MGNVNVDLTEIMQSLKNIENAIKSIETTKTSINKKYQQLGNDWNDKRFMELGDTIIECNNALNDVLKNLLKAQKYIVLLIKSIREYEEINFTYSNGAYNNNTHTHISTDEQRFRWQNTLNNIDELIQNYRKGLIENGVNDGYLLTKFLANQRALMLQYEGELLNVASGNRPPLEESEIYNYVVVGENSPYSFHHLRNEFGDFCLNEINSWIKQINYNPNNDPRRDVNCGKCAAAVFLRLNGDSNAVAGLGTYSIEEMNTITGHIQTTMTPTQIENYLREQGAGSHVVVGVDRASGAGHWFNAFFDGRQVYTIESQGGYMDGWPPDYGNVVHWDASI